MIFSTIHHGSYVTNTYIYGDEETNEVFVIDVGDGYDRIISKIQEKNYKVKYILITHGHFDHTRGIKQLRQLTGAKVYMNQRDLAMVEDADCIDGFISEGDAFTVGGCTLKVIETPGHSPGGVCYQGDGLIFTGDTLFKSSIGRTDFEGGSYPELIDSITNKLMKFSDDIKIYPGHGWSTTIGYERNNNPFLI